MKMVNLCLVPDSLRSYLSCLVPENKSVVQLIERIVSNELAGIGFDLIVVHLLLPFFLTYHKKLCSDLVTKIKYRLKKYPSKGLLGPSTAEDIFQTAMEKILTGERHWNYRLIDFFHYVLLASYSIIDDYYKKSKLQPEEVIYTRRNAHKNLSPQNVLRYQKASDCDYQRTIEIAEDLEIFINQLDPRLIHVLIALYDKKSTKEMAEEFGVSLAEVKNLRKRLRRAASKRFAQNYQIK